MIYQFVLAAALVLVSHSQKSYERYKVIELDLKTDEQIELILKLSELYEADIWKGPSKVDSTHIMLSPESCEKFLKIVESMQIHYKILNANVQNTIDKEYISNNLLKFQSMVGLRTSRSLSELSDHYASLEEIEMWMEKISEINNFISVGSIGTSYEGRDIKYIKISSGKNRKAILMDGGIHAREWLAVATVNFIVEQMIHDYKSGKRATISLLSKYDFYFIPVLNPDGYAFSHLRGNRLWRKNRHPFRTYDRICYGTDLNRNFDAAFGGAKTSSDPCSDLFKGPFAFSEPETKAFSNFIQSFKSQLLLYMSLHSYAQFWFVPYAYTSVPSSDDKEMRRVANIGNSALFKANGERFKVGTPSELLYSAAGGSFDWVKLKAGVKYAYTLEVRPKWGSSHGGEGFIAPLSDIKESGKEVYEGFMATAEAIVN